MPVRRAVPAPPVPTRPGGDVAAARPTGPEPARDALSAEVWQSLLLLGLLVVVTVSLAGAAALLVLLLG